jgi:iron complex transport system ATP-binding protein
MLEAHELTLRVPGRVLCEKLNARFMPGESWAILGANGAGKTTLLHALAGLRAPDAGKVHWDGRDVSSLSRRQLAQTLAVLLQDEAEGFWGSALDWVRLGRYPRQPAHRAKDEALARAALEQVGMGPLATRTMATLSGGERQRVRLAMVLAQVADAGQAVLLDEPLQHLDLRSQVAMLEVFAGLARREGKTVIMVLHDVYWASRHCDKTLLVFGDGRIAQGETRTVLNPENMQALYGCPLAMVEAGGGRLFLPTGARP